jgi:hypothetical protein
LHIPNGVVGDGRLGVFTASEAVVGRMDEQRRPEVRRHHPARLHEFIEGDGGLT